MDSAALTPADVPAADLELRRKSVALDVALRLNPHDDVAGLVKSAKVIETFLHADRAE